MHKVVRVPLKAFTLILLGLTTLCLTSQAQSLYWVGGDGSWDNPGNWAATPYSEGGVGVPDHTSFVFITTDGNILIDGAAVCRSLEADSGLGHVLTIEEGSSLTVRETLHFEEGSWGSGIGDLNVGGSSSGAVFYAPSWIVQGEVEFIRDVDLGSHLYAAGPRIVVDGQLNTAGFDVISNHIDKTSAGSLIWGGTQVYQPETGIDQPEIPFAPMPMFNTDCATSGANPYTIDIEITSDYNGEEISCNDAEDGALTVGITGGIGPFSFQWVGGTLPPTFTQSVSGLGAGTYTVLVTDLGQGTICSETTVLNAPAAITLLDFEPTSPTCANICDGSADVDAIGGTGTLDYVWSNGELGDVANMLCVGNNQLTVTDANGCAYTTDIPLDVDSLFANVTITDVTCNGLSDGSATANPFGGDGGPYDISWSNGDTGPNMADQPAGFYTVTVSDPAGCVVDSTFEITEAPELVLALDNTLDPQCGGASTGAIEMTISGGLPPYIIGWTGPNGFVSDQEDISDLESGSYELTVTDAANCIQTLTVDLNGPAAVTIDEVLEMISCSGADDGSIDITPLGGTPGYDFLWTGPGAFSETTEDIADLEPGTYTLELTDGLGCLETFSFDITEPVTLTVDAAITPITCNAADNGAIDVTVNGGTLPFTFDWDLNGSGTSSDEDLIDLEPGTYTLTITDGAGCQITQPWTLDEPALIELTTAVTPLTCAGELNGAIDLTITGAVDPVSVSWTGPNAYTSDIEDISGLEAGTFTVEVTDGNGCLASTSVDLQEQNPIDVSADVTAIDCAGNDSGAIDLTLSGGTAPLTPSWSGPAGFTSGSEDITDLEPGTYDLTITDGAGCSIQASFDIIEAPALDVTSTVGEISCAGDDNGFIDLTIAGGTEPVTVTWTLPDFSTVDTEDLTDLGPGDYSAHVADANGCFVDLPFTLVEPEALTISGVTTDVTCGGDADGAIDLTIVGGTAPFDVVWNGPAPFTASGDDILDLSGGTYDVTVTDASGCQATESFDVLEAPELIVTSDVFNPTCGSTGLGAIDLTITGGTPGIDVSWTGPGSYTSTDEDISGLDSGTYDVVVSDAAGCSETLSFEITSLDPIVADFDVTDIGCTGPGTGGVDLTLSGGTPPFTVTWTFPDMSTFVGEDIIGVPAGDYQVLIEDAAGCSLLQGVTIDEALPFDVTVDITDASCAGIDDGSIELTIAGGTPPFDVVWNTTDTGQLLEDLAPGTYSATITDGSGCFTSLDDLIVNEAAPILVDALVQDISCGATDDGAIDITITSGTAPFMVSWTGPAGFSESIEDISDLEAGSYNLSITDAGGCTFNETYDITAPNLLDISSVVVDPACGGESSVELTINDGTPPYSVTWTGPSAFTSDQLFITDLEAGQYIADVADSFGCTSSLTFDIVDAEPVSAQELVIQPDCSVATGSIELLISGGTGPYGVMWTADNGFTSTDEDIFDLDPGTYTYDIADINGCLASGMIEIIAAPVLDYSIDSSAPLCAGIDDGAIDLTITQGTEPYTILWSGPNGFTSPAEDIDDLEPGTYTLDLSDAAGCSITTTVDLSAVSGITVVGLITDLECAGLGTGAVDITVTGGAEPYTFAWSSLPFFTSDEEDLSDLEAGTYNLVVTDANGCEQNYAATVIENDPILIDVVTTNSTCGNFDGTASATVSGGEPPYSFTWLDMTGGQLGTTLDVEFLGAGVYTLQVQDGTGCVETMQVNISDTEGPQISGDVLHPGCLGGFTGAIDLTVTGDGPFQFFWFGPALFFSFDEDISDVQAGLYQVEVIDANGCESNATFILDAPSNLTITPDITALTCGDPTSGAIDVSFTGGNPPYTFAWSGPNAFTSDQEDITGLEAGTYNLLITDGNGCTGDLSVTLEEVLALDVTANINHIDCFGGDEGSLDLVISGGTEPYVYSWTGPNGFVSSNQDLTELFAGDYNLSVSDAVGCATDITFTVNEGAEIILDVIETNPSCGQDNGMLEAIVSGGTIADDYVYTWFDLQNGGAWVGSEVILDDMPAGSYELIVADDLGCSAQIIGFLGNADAVVQGIVSDNACADEEFGSINTWIDGGIAPFIFSWVGPSGFTADTEDIVLLESGEYVLNVQDASGCLFGEVFTVNEPLPLQADLTYGDVLCHDDPSGSILTDVTGGTAPYSFDWTGPLGFSSTDQNLFDLEPGCYQLTLTDANGCVVNAEACINQPNDMQASALITDISCPGDATGVILSTVVGGTPDFTYAWTGPNSFSADTQLIEDLEAGLYELVITDINGCTLDTSFTVVNLAGLMSNPTITAPSCVGGFNGTISLNPDGGEEPYTFSWTGPDGYTNDVQDISDLEPGDYELTMTDFTGCSTTETFTVPNPIELDLTAVSTDVTCFGDDNGSIDLTIIDGVAPFTIDWSGPNAFTSDQEDLSDLEDGTYDVSVTDANLCVAVLSVDILSPDSLGISLDGITDLICFNDPIGAIDITIESGSEPLVFDWSGPGSFTSDQEDLTDLLGGTYDLLLTDAFGCTLDTSFAVIAPDSILANPSVTQPDCVLDIGGSITLEPTGGSEPYTTSWTGPDAFTSSDEDISDLISGDYEYTLTDADGCVITATVNVPNPIGLDLTVVADSVSCFGLDDGAIDLTITGGVEPFTIGWDGPDGFTADTEDLSDLEAGTYDLTVEDSDFCTAVLSVEVGQPDSLGITLDTLMELACFNDTTGAIEITVSSGSGPFEFQWVGPELFSSEDEDIYDLIGGAYDLQVTDAHGCTLTDSFFITTPDSLLANATVTPPVCEGNIGGTIDLEPEGGSEPYGISWTGPDSFASSDEDLVDLNPGDYIYTLVDAGGCSITDTVNVPNPLGLDLTAVIDSTTCFGAQDASIDLTISGGAEPFNIVWTGPGSFVSNDEDISNLAPGTYEVTVTEGDLCSAFLTVEITEPQELIITLEDVTPVACFGGNDGAIDISISGGTGEYEILWAGPGMNADTEDISDLISGFYFVQVSDEHGCTAELLDIQVELNGTVFAEAGADLIQCEGEALVTLNGINTDGNQQGWYDMDGNLLTEDSEYIIDPSAGDYTFIFAVSDGICTHSDTVEVNILPLPLADAGDDISVYMEDVIQLGGSPSVEDNSIFDWTPGIALQDSSEANPWTIEMMEETVFVLEVVGENGCYAADSITVSIIPLLDVPSGFSPNDDGMNDDWQLGYLSFYPNTQVQVFNRWGDLVFESDRGYNAPWDGRYNDQPLPIGTYYFVINVNEPEFPKPLTGPVTILR